MPDKPLPERNKDLYMENDKIQLFEDKKIRTAWDEEEEEWYFSVMDVVAVLTDSVDPKQYIKKMRRRDPEFNSKWGTICTPVQMTAADGKKTKNSSCYHRGNIKACSVNSLTESRAVQGMVSLCRCGAN